MQQHELSDDEKLAIRLMAACGWKHEQAGNIHHFSLESGGASAVRELHTGWALNRCGNPELLRRIEETKRAWLAEFLPSEEEE